jgi:acyl carrier protein
LANKEWYMDQLEREIRSFIADTYLPAQSADEIDAGASLTRAGIIDSVGILELMLFLETDYGIDIPDDEAVPENLDTIGNITRYVRSKRVIAPPADLVVTAPAAAIDRV